MLITQPAPKVELTDVLIDGQLPLSHSGKVRDTYLLPDHPELLLVVTSDRISIFDFILSSPVPGKGEILNAMSCHWFELLTKQGIRHHLVARGAAIDPYLPESLRNNSSLQRRAMVVRRLKMVPVECIVRGYLTGSGWKSYQKDGAVCGIALPEGLHDGSQFAEPIFTPTTKAEFGHDEDLDAAAVIEEYGPELASLSLRIYRLIAAAAAQYGIILADTKFEFGIDGEGRLVLADEVGTPDSSRFWDAQEHAAAIAEQRSPGGYDKELVRQWGKSIPTEFTKDGVPIVGLDHLDPKNVPLDPTHPAHNEWVRNELQVPAEVIMQTIDRYRKIFRRLTGFLISGYQRDIMGIY